MKAFLIDLAKGAGRWLWSKIKGDLAPPVCAICGGPAVAVQHSAAISGSAAHTFLPLRR